MDMNKTTIDKAIIQYLKTTCSTCPECGFRVTVRIDRFGTFTWFVGLCSLLTCFGISVDQIGLFTVPVIFNDGPHLSWEHIVPELIGFGSLVIATIIWWRCRLAIDSWNTVTNYTVLFFACLLPFAYFSLLLSIVLF